MQKILLSLACLAITTGCSGKPAPTTLEVRDSQTQVTVGVTQETPPPVRPEQGAPAKTPTGGDTSVTINGQGVSAQAGDSKVEVGQGGVVASGGAGRVRIDAGGVAVSAPAAGVKVDSQGVAVQAGEVERENGKLVVRGLNQRKTVTCDGEDVEVDGTGHQLVFKGRVGKLEINGTGNSVRCENARELELNGTNNQALWSGTEPVVELNGINNSATQE